MTQLAAHSLSREAILVVASLQRGWTAEEHMQPEQPSTWHLTNRDHTVAHPLDVVVVAELHAAHRLWQAAWTKPVDGGPITQRSWRLVVGRDMSKIAQDDVVDRLMMADMW